MAESHLIYSRRSLPVKEPVKERAFDRHQRCHNHTKAFCVRRYLVCLLRPILADHQAAFAKQCAEASLVCGDWRKISARKNPEIGELRQKSVVQIPDHPSPHVLPQPSGLGKLVWSIPSKGPRCFGCRGVSAHPWDQALCLGSIGRLPRDVTSPAACL